MCHHKKIIKKELGVNAGNRNTELDKGMKKQSILKW